LCLATVLVLVTWASVWELLGYPIYSQGQLVPLVLSASLLLLGGLLWMVRQAKQLVARRAR
jgi:hypothetical protein